MKLSFSLPSKPQSKSKSKTSFTTSASEDQPSITKSYVTEFKVNEPIAQPESTVKPIPPIPNEWRPNKKLKNLPNLPSLQSDSSLQFELDPGSNPEPVDGPTTYGLNIRSTANGKEVKETVSDWELRKLREDLGKLPEGTTLDEFTEVPVEGFGAALLSGYGWKEGRGIGRNAKEDIKTHEIVKKAGRGGLGFMGELPGDNRNETNVSDKGVSKRTQDSMRDKQEVENRNWKRKKGFDEGQEVRIVNGREMGKKGSIVEVRNDGDILFVRLKSGDKVKARSADVVKVGSVEEEKCLTKMKELKIRDKNGTDSKRVTNSSSKRDREDERIKSERDNWLTNHIRVRVVSEKLKGGRLYLKKGVVVDVVGPGLCDIAMDESRELIQGVDQDLLETALPRYGGPVLVLYGRHKGVYGSLQERDSEKETGIVQDADTHELLNVRLDQIAEYAGDPSDIGY